MAVISTAIFGDPITTHADAFRFDDFFKNKLGYSQEKMVELQSKVHHFLLSIYEFIEKNYGQYVEIGRDFAIDVAGKFWFIEANSQSTKVSLQKAYDKAVLSRAYKNILEYARYLFEQTLEGDQT